MLKPGSARARLSGAWSRLPSRERLVLVLLFYEGLTPTEAARALGCTVGEIERLVEARLARLLGALRAAARRAPARRRRRAAAVPRRWAA
jgi:DNA-directed RNA polymerase specialized sigma24 family protein